MHLSFVWHKMYLEDLPSIAINKVVGSIWQSRKVGISTFYTSSTVEYRICQVKRRISLRMRASGIPDQWRFFTLRTDYVRQMIRVFCQNCGSGAHKIYWDRSKKKYVCRRCCELPSIRSVMQSKLSAEVRRQLRIGDYSSVALLLKDLENLIPVRLAMEREGLVPLIYTACLHRKRSKRLSGSSLWLRCLNGYGRLIYADGRLYARR